MTGWSWSALLAGFGVVGLYLAGRDSWWGWALGLLDEALWVVYAVSTRQWPFCLSALAYGWVYGRNLRAWRRRGSPVGETTSQVHSPDRRFHRLTETVVGQVTE